MNVSPGGYGRVLVDGVAPDSYPADLEFESGEAVTVEAVPVPGYRFDGWGGDLSGITNPATLVIDCNKTVTAVFSEIMHTLTVEVSGTGSVSPRGSHDYNRGTAILRADIYASTL